MTLRYEDLCADPDGDADPAPRLHRRARPATATTTSAPIEHHIIGNRMRLSSTSEIRLDERWKEALTPEQIAVIERHVAPLNRRYGYGSL